jgi:hypothetical protein
MPNESKPKAQPLDTPSDDPNVCIHGVYLRSACSECELSQDVRNGFICAEWKQIGEGPILDFATMRRRQVVYRCDRPDGHKGDHVDSVLFVSWKQSEPAPLDTPPCNHVWPWRSNTGFEDCNKCGIPYFIEPQYSCNWNEWFNANRARFRSTIQLPAGVSIGELELWTAEAWTAAISVSRQSEPLAQPLDIPRSTPMLSGSYYAQAVEFSYRLNSEDADVYGAALLELRDLIEKCEPLDTEGERQQDDGYLARAEKFMANAAKLGDSPLLYMIAAAFKNEDRAQRAEAKLAALPELRVETGHRQINSLWTGKENLPCGCPASTEYIYYNSETKHAHCIKCGDAYRHQSQIVDTEEHPCADCEGCNKPDCPCNAREYEGQEAVAYSDGFITGREAGYHHCGSCSHAWEGHDGECKAYMNDGSICGCRKIVTNWVDTEGDKQELVSTPCCNYSYVFADRGPIYWNSLNGVVQCHNCGHSFGSNVKSEPFDSWWARDGRGYDPDTEDVSWFDKRKELAEYTWLAALSSKPVTEEKA